MVALAAFARGWCRRGTRRAGAGGCRSTGADGCRRARYEEVKHRAVVSALHPSSTGEDGGVGRSPIVARDAVVQHRLHCGRMRPRRGHTRLDLGASWTAGRTERGRHITLLLMAADAGASRPACSSQLRMSCSFPAPRPGCSEMGVLAGTRKWRSRRHSPAPSPRCLTSHGPSKPTRFTCPPIPGRRSGSPEGAAFSPCRAARPAATARVHIGQVHHGPALQVDPRRDDRRRVSRPQR